MKLPDIKTREAILEKTAKRRAILESALETVVKGYTPALFVYGPAGLGKTHLLTTMLDGMGAGQWKHHTAYSTPKALFLALAESPSAIHLFEDCERLMKLATTSTILRAACGAPDGKPRWVTYETAHEKFRVNVTGGIIVATNANLARDNGPMSAVASRFRPIKWDMGLDERIALIASIAEKGYHRGKTSLKASQCCDVAEFLIDACDQGQCDADLDIRLYTEHALPVYAHAIASGEKNWKDVVLAKLHGVASTNDENQEARASRLQSMAEMIACGPGKTADKIAVWQSRTGLGRAIYFRHLKAARKK